MKRMFKSESLHNFFLEMGTGSVATPGLGQMCVCRTGSKYLSCVLFFVFLHSRADGEQGRAVAVPLVGTLEFSLWPVTSVCSHGQQSLGCGNAGEIKSFSIQSFSLETGPCSFLCGCVELLWPDWYLPCWVCRHLKNI